jgi:hypothetical protein
LNCIPHYTKNVALTTSMDKKDAILVPERKKDKSRGNNSGLAA